jgi:hypothetical protein
MVDEVKVTIDPYLSRIGGRDQTCWARGDQRGQWCRDGWWWRERDVLEGMRFNSAVSDPYGTIRLRGDTPQRREHQ